jgi:predicted DCC family thiol-disulfide oxidoreductase YuxK
MDEAVCLAAMQLVLENGTVRSGEAAFPYLFRLMPRWRWVAAVFSCPGASWAAPLVYRWVVRHRYELSIVAGHKGGQQQE